MIFISIYYIEFILMFSFTIIPNNLDDIRTDDSHDEGVLIPESCILNTIWNSYNDFTDDLDNTVETDYFKISSFLVNGLYGKHLETAESLDDKFSEFITNELLYIGDEDFIYYIMDNSCEPMYITVWNAYISMLERIVHSYHKNGDRAFQ